MAKHKKKIKQPLQPTPLAENTSSSFSVSDHFFALLVTLLYAIVVFFGIFHHEPWRDEIQAWLIARDSHSIPELFRNLIYEGHPALWHLLLFVITRFTADPFVMQLLHGVMATATIFLFTRYATFSRVQKVLFAAGYFLIFEYSMVARNYVAGIFFMMLFMILYKDKTKNALYLGVTLLLMANTNIYALIIAGCLFAVWMIDLFVSHSPGKILLFAGIALSVTGMLLAAWQIKPNEHSRNYLQLMDHFDLTRLRFAMADMVRAFFPLPVFWAPSFWNSNLIIKNQINISKEIFFISILLWLLFALLFLRNRNAFLFYVCASLGILGFTYYTYLPYLRYVGHLYIIFIIAWWLAETKTSNSHYQRFIPSFLLQFSNWIYKIRNLILLPLLIIQLIAGVFSWYSDITGIFSQNEATGNYLMKEKLNKYEIVGYSDVMTVGIAGWIDKPLFYCERSEYGTFLKWDDQRRQGLPIQQAVDDVFKRTRNKKEPVIFVSNSQLNANGIPVTEVVLIDSIRMTLLNKLMPSIVPEESFYIYKIQRIK